MGEPVTLWRYDVARENPGDSWAEVVLSSNGFFATVSDYGNYAFAWRHFGPEDFRAFFIGLDAAYVHGKITGCSGRARHVYDPDESLRAIKGIIIRQRRHNQITREAARDAWDELEEYGWLVEAGEWTEWAMHSKGSADLEINVHDLYEEAYYTKPEPESWAFVTKLLPRIQERVRAELTGAGGEFANSANTPTTAGSSETR